MYAKLAMAAVLALLLTGCADYGGGYRDGAYYQPSRGSEGDYYYGRPPAKRGYYTPYYGPYGFPYYYSPYPYYLPYRYRPYFGPYQSFYYHSGFGAAYAYGGFSGYRDYGYPYFSTGFGYRDHDRYHHRYRDRDDRDDYGRGERDDHDDFGRGERDDHDRNRRQHDGADRVGDLPIVARRDAQLPGYGNDPRNRGRFNTQPAPRFRDASRPLPTVRMESGIAPVTQMRRVDVEPGSRAKWRNTGPGPRIARVAPDNAETRLRVDPAREPVRSYRGNGLDRQPQARERTFVTARNPSPSRAGAAQRTLNERPSDAGKKPRNRSQLDKSADEVEK